MNVDTIANDDVTPSGEFVMMQSTPATPHISVILNWAQSLPALVDRR